MTLKFAGCWEAKRHIQIYSDPCELGRQKCRHCGLLFIQTHIHILALGQQKEFFQWFDHRATLHFILSSYQNCVRLHISVCVYTQVYRHWQLINSKEHENLPKKSPFIWNCWDFIEKCGCLEISERAARDFFLMHTKIVAYMTSKSEWKKKLMMSVFHIAIQVQFLCVNTIKLQTFVCE